MEKIIKEKYKIAVIEDEEILSESISGELEDDGFLVVKAFDGESGLELVRKEKPDLILLDIIMSKQDGFYVLGAVRTNPEWKPVPIIVLSNLGGDAEIKRALAMGADDYFVKSQHPIEMVVEKVKEYLEGGKSINPPKIGT
ncbi:MAG: response regulator [Patescibacteria group bacterium]